MTHTVARGPFFDPGSPYATKNYFAVTAAMGDPSTETEAFNEFSNFVSQCDGYTGSVGTINIMLDFVANHTSWDSVFGQGAVDIGIRTDIDDTNSALVAASDSIGTHRQFWYAEKVG